METQESLPTPEKEISRAALKVAIGGGLSLIAGLAGQVVTAYLFGAGSEMDAFFTALTVPLYLQIVLLGGLPFVVIPAFVRAQVAGNEDEAWSLTGTMLTLTTVILTLAACLGVLFSPKIIELCAPGFSPQKAELAARMLAILMFTVPFSGLASFTSGVENVRGRYFWPAAATAIGSLGNVIVLLILQPFLGSMALALGNLVSSMLMAAVTTTPILMHGWKKRMAYQDPKIVELLKLISPFILFGLITNSRLLLERYFASMLPDGQLSYMGYANKLSNIFIVLLASSIASAYFPAMARSFSHEGVHGLEGQAQDGLKMTMALALPVVVICTMLGIPLVHILFERGAFTSDTTIFVSSLIPIVLVNEVLFRMITNIVGRTFFILKDTITTNLISSLTIVIYIVAAYFLIRKWEFWGLALAQPIQVAFSILLMAVLLKRKLPSFPFSELVSSSMKYLAISLIAGFSIWLTNLATGQFSYLAQLLIGGFCSITVYLALLYFVDRKRMLAILEMTGLPRIQNAIQTRYRLNHRVSHP